MLKKKNLREGLIFYNSLRPFLKTVFEKLAKDQNLHALLFEVIEISILNEYDLPNLYSLIKEYEVMKMPLNLINGYFHKDSFNNDTSRLNKKILLNSINFLKFGFLNSEIRKQNKYNFQNIFTQLIDLILTNLTTVASDINRHFLKQINLLELIKLMIQFLEQVVEEEDYFNTEHLVAKFNIPYLTNEILEHLEKNAILKNSAVFDVMDNSCIEQLFIYKFRLLLMLNLIDKCNYQKIKQSNNLPILCSTLFTTSMDPDEMKTILFVVNKFFFEKSFFENVAVLNKNTKIDFLKLNQKVKEDETSVKFIKKEGCKSSETMDDLESIENMERVLVEVTEKFNLENKLRASLLNKKIEIFEN
ncbi:hypothetical protein HK099_002840 [Clydaea vesicula]|uniref:Uncharacterized protein n=1 Tax=Clydaea vesicula TaxID=447962 RepID=A0AAD5XWI7_9FUNG|nr:hypothetical protein HK099_002840 [Clydaea vesicula]